jgi:protein-tyrosine phosphatase
MLISDAVHIWREPDGEYHIEWQVTDPGTEVTVEPLATDGELQLHYSRQPLTGARLVGLAPARRHFFRLRDQHGTEVVATERRLGMDGAPNFRDFGGYRTASGKQVKWGFLFRSGQLSALSEQDVSLLASLELDLVFDFRRLEEQETDMSRLPLKRRPKVVSLPIIPGSNSRFFEQAGQQSGAGDPAAMFEFMLEINRDFAGPQAVTYSRMFREILAAPDARFLVHCAAGKDRTGFAAAMILLALGVPRDLVMRDYLLTARYYLPDRELERLRRKYQLEHMVAESILPMLEVHEDYLAMALRHIEDNYASIEEYLEQALGVGPVELAELRARYLE